ncbi:MAG: hypothetical protein ABGY96_27170 [bacterium]
MSSIAIASFSSSFSESLASASDSVDDKMSRITIVVDGMMKSKSGAT